MKNILKPFFLSSLLLLTCCQLKVDIDKEVTQPKVIDKTKTTNIANPEGYVTKEEGILCDGIQIPFEKLNPVKFKQGNRNYLILDCKDSIITTKTIEQISIYIPAYDWNQRIVGFMYIENDKLYTHLLKIEDELLNELLKDSKEADPSEKSRYLEIINFENLYIIRHRENEDNEDNIAEQSIINKNDFTVPDNVGAINEYNSVDTLLDSNIQYYDGLNPVSFTDNPITNIIPKGYFTKEVNDVYIGDNYGFYINTLSTNNSNKLLSHFLVFSTLHSRGEKTISIPDIRDDISGFQNGIFSFELRPVIQGTCDYYIDTNTVCNFQETDNLCIDNPTYSYHFNNTNGKYNDDDTWFYGENSCYSRTFRYAFNGQTKKSQNYTPIFKDIKYITSFLKKLPINDPTIKFIIDATDDLAYIADKSYEFVQKHISDKYDQIDFKRDTTTNKITAFKEVSAGINGTDIRKRDVDLTHAYRGSVFSLDKQYNDDYPILLKNKEDYFKFYYEIEAHNTNEIYAQTIIDTLSFNVKQDDTTVFNKKVKLLKSKSNIKKAWKLFYDPSNEYKKTNELELGKEYYLNYGNTDTNPKSYSEFTYKPTMDGTFYFLSNKYLTNSEISITNNNGNAINLTTLQNKEKTKLLSCTLKEDETYKIKISGTNKSSGFTIFTCYYYGNTLYQQSSTSYATSLRSKSPISCLYKFTPKSCNISRANYLLSTAKKEDNIIPDTSISIMNMSFETITYSDNTVDSSGKTSTTSRLLASLAVDEEYYVSLTLQNLTHDLESCFLTLIPCERVSPSKSDMLINYKFTLEYDSKAYCFLITPSMNGNYTFRIFGNDISNDISATLIKAPDITLSSAFSPGNEPVITSNLTTDSYYYLMVYHYFPYRQVTSTLQLNYWINK